MMKFQFFSPMDEELWADCIELARHWFPLQYSDSLAEDLFFTYPKTNINDTYLKILLPTNWKKFYNACYQINNSCPGIQLESWRFVQDYGDEIFPGSGIYRLRDFMPLYLFWIFPAQDTLIAQKRFADLIPKLSIYWHILYGRGLFHASGINHKKYAYLFVGDSGAGKSTVSSISSMLGDSVIHDDHVILYRDEEKTWYVSDASSSVQSVPLRAVLFLIQDNRDQIVFSRQTKVAENLLESLYEHGSDVLQGDILRSALLTCADIARSVPGYELHFRKSPDFWKLIDAEFPD